MPKSLCKRKRVKPNKCKKLRGCKVARGTKRTFCRKARNKTNKKRGTYKRKRIRGGNTGIENEKKIKFIKDLIDENLILPDKLGFTIEYGDMIKLYDKLATIGGYIGQESTDHINELIQETLDALVDHEKLEIIATRNYKHSQENQTNI